MNFLRRLLARASSSNPLSKTPASEPDLPHEKVPRVVPRATVAELKWEKGLSEAIASLPVSQILPAHLLETMRFPDLEVAVSAAADHIKKYYPEFGESPASFVVGRELSKSSGKYRYHATLGNTLELHFGAGFSYWDVSVTKHDENKYSIEHVTYDSHEDVGSEFSYEPFNYLDALAKAKDFRTKLHGDQIEAIKNLTDQAELLRIGRTDRDPDFRRAAFSRLADQALLIEIALHERDVHIRADAVESLTDQALLQQLGTEDGEHLVRGAAAKALKDERVLEQMAVGDENECVRRIASNRLTNAAALARVVIYDVKNSSTFDIREAAVEKISDQDILAQVAIGDGHYCVYEAAVKRISDTSTLAKIATEGRGGWEKALDKLEDEELLSKVAIEGKSEGARKAAVRKLSDEAILAKLAIASEHYEVRLEAVAKLKDEALLAGVARDGNGSGAEESVRKIKNPSILADIARNGPSLIRRVAARRINDEKLILEIAKTVKHTDVLEAIAPKLKDQALLFEIGRANGIYFGIEIAKLLTDKAAAQSLIAEVMRKDRSLNDGWARMNAVEMLYDQASLIEFAKNDADWRVREKAVSRIDDQVILAEFAGSDTDSSIRTAAVKKLQSKALLESIGEFDSDGSVRYAAKERILALRNM